MATSVLDHAPAIHAEKTGIWSWITTVDHKRIGILYGTTAFIFFLLGGIEALIMRLQLMKPDNTLVTPEMFNSLFTMHGTTMIFLGVMPLSAMFFNFFIPLHIGARDVAFPRLNAFSYWVFLLGGLFINFSFLLNAAPNAGWFGYANLTENTYSPGLNTDFWVLGLQILGIASMAAALNFFVTIVNLRAPGMKMLRMPMFVWMSFITQMLLLLAFPVITVALVFLMMDRHFGSHFFLPEGGGDPVLWQHLFWIFGHPEVYILILPAFGIVSEVLPVFSRKPLFGYTAMVFSGAFIAFLGFGVWSHHMFATGMGPFADSFFAISTMLIAVPTGVKIFNWIGTLWGGSLQFKTPLYFAVGMVAMFIIGGLSGIFMAATPVDIYIHDTFFIVAHIHYVLFASSLMGIFGAIYYWFPKMFGRMMSEPLGKVHFLLTFVLLNCTFFPMHLVGVMGLRRRIADVTAGALEAQTLPLNQFMSVSALLLGTVQLIFVVNFFWSLFFGVRGGMNPWHSNTLEWTAPSPPPHGNFVTDPIVYRWPYEYGEHEGHVDDYVPQTARMEGLTGTETTTGLPH
jgi:cytochrome c oxidase subunit 1